ncbi:MAG: hypothetical protein IKV55_00130 [Oscillospiraceae bacterium]|nr:hypothetical protein [Oscillospiraceae bacterium]
MSQPSKTQSIGKEITLLEFAKIAAAPVFSQFALSLLNTLDNGLFISRFLGTEALAAFSLCMPLMMFMNCIMSLLGGCANHCSARMGEGRTKDARGDFTTMAIVCVVFGVISATLVTIFMDPLLHFLGATDPKILEYCRIYAGVEVWFFPVQLISMLFNRFYVPAGKPKFNMVATLTTAFCNIFFDWLFVANLGIGMIGVCLADLIGLVAVTVFGFIFYSGKTCEIGFGTPSKNVFWLIARVFKLGYPQMITTLSLSVNHLITNKVLLAVGDELAVSANTIVNNIQFLMMAAFFGLYSATSPRASFAYGEKNAKKLGKVIKQAIALTAILSAVVIGIYLIGHKPIAELYFASDADPELRRHVTNGLLVAPLAFVFFGFVVLAEHTFAAIHNSKASSIVTICESLIFSNLSILTMPYLIGDMWGVWLSFPAYEFVTFLVAAFLAWKMRDVYGYGKSGRATAFETAEPAAVPAEAAEAAAE